MDLVLGVSMTSQVVRWVLVEGRTGEGAHLDHGALDADDPSTFDAESLVQTLLRGVDDTAQSRIHSVGLTWTSDAESAAGVLMEALATRGLDRVVSVSEIEAAEALAAGVADIAGYDDVGVCVVEPGVALVTMVDPEGPVTEPFGLAHDSADAAAVAAAVTSTLDLYQRHPEAVFVLGSGDVDAVAAALTDLMEPPVVTAAGADLAMARGAALVSALTFSSLDEDVARPAASRVGVLASVLAAAVVVFVISLSVALGLNLRPASTPEAPANANAAEVSKPPAAAPTSIAQAAPAPRSRPAAPPPAAPPVVETILAAAPPAPEALPEPAYNPPAAGPVDSTPAYISPAPAYIPPAPAYVPPAPAYVPPAPAYVPPPAPAYVPQAPPQEPRLRDKIIDKIPIINRFHEPEYPYGQ
jgi:hypothetical protein